MFIVLLHLPVSRALIFIYICLLGSLNILPEIDVTKSLTMILWNYLKNRVTHLWLLTAERKIL